MAKRNSRMAQIIPLMMVILAVLAGTNAQSGATVTRARLLFTNQMPAVVEDFVNVGNQWAPFFGQRLSGLAELVENFQMTEEQHQQILARQGQIKQIQQPQFQRQQEQQPQLQQLQQQPKQAELVENFQMTEEQHQQLQQLQQQPQQQQQQQQPQLQHQQPQPQPQLQQQPQQELQPHQFLLKEIVQNKNNLHSLTEQKNALSQSDRIQQTLERSLVQSSANEIQEQQKDQQNSNTNQQIQQPTPSILSNDSRPKQANQNLNVQHTTQSSPQQEQNNGFQLPHSNQKLMEEVQKLLFPQQNQVVNQEETRGDLYSNYDAIEEPQPEPQGQFIQAPFQNEQSFSGVPLQQIITQQINNPNEVRLESHFQQQNNFENDPVLRHLSSEIQLLDREISQLSQQIPQQNVFGQISGQTVPFEQEQSFGQFQNQNSQSHQQSSQLFDQQFPQIPLSPVSQVNSQLFVSNSDNTFSSRTQQSQQQQFNQVVGLNGFNPQHLPQLNTVGFTSDVNPQLQQLNINQNQFDPEFNQQFVGISNQVPQETPVNNIHRVDGQLQSEQFDHESLQQGSHQNQQPQQQFSSQPPQQQLLSQQPQQQLLSQQNQQHLSQQPQQNLISQQPQQQFLSQQPQQNLISQQPQQNLVSQQPQQQLLSQQPQQQLLSQQPQQQLLSQQPQKNLISQQPQQQFLSQQPQQQLLQLQPAEDKKQFQQQIQQQQSGQHKANSKCRRPCQKILNIVCGSDGISYTNPCELGNSKCSDKTLVQLHEGVCESSSSVAERRRGKSLLSSTSGGKSSSPTSRGKSLSSTPAKGNAITQGSESTASNEIPPGILALFAVAGPPSEQGTL